MTFPPQAYHSHSDPENFPPARDPSELPFEGVEMPDFIKDEEVR